MIAMLGPVCEFLLDALVGAGLGELIGNSDAVEDCLVVGRSVADDAHTAHAKQRCATILRVIQAAAEIIECAAREAHPPGR